MLMNVNAEKYCLMYSFIQVLILGLVVLTTLAGYGMAPGVVEPTALLCMLVGTAFTSAAANSINQVLL